MAGCLYNFVKAAVYSLILSPSKENKNDYNGGNGDLSWDDLKISSSEVAASPHAPINNTQNEAERTFKPRSLASDKLSFVEDASPASFTCSPSKTLEGVEEESLDSYLYVETPDNGDYEGGVTMFDYKTLIIKAEYDSDRKIEKENNDEDDIKNQVTFNVIVSSRDDFEVPQDDASETNN